MRHSWKLGWLIYPVLGVVALLLYMDANRFPYFYHPDEPSKVKQVATWTYNYHHPLLLVESTRRIRKVVTEIQKSVGLRPPGTKLTPQEIVQIGRGVSAFYAAITVVCAAGIGMLAAGRAGSVCAGIAVLLSPQLYTHAHFMKEECSLVMGLAVAFLGLVSFEKNRNVWSALACGIGWGWP